ncbi:probable E3 ubiquitin-protein ligase RNF217 isoform X1 [Neltuma alba]|uniref:probable E3 ubiquitin-protein ligase RNF217 isoform X1 n=1 Tax=Neltuma alba TaxID=207710 RepID=UPI0010A4961F|nr:probable E3 ubiquitin-protein ligase RNF217 isoform X1 [Prosopis alba]
MAQDSASDLLCSDDSFLSALFHEDEDGDGRAPFTDDECAQRLQLQETLYSSLITSQKPNNDPSPPPPPPLLLLPASSSPSVPLKMADNCPTPETDQVKCSNETGESSQVICEICAENKEASQMFRNQRCHHSFCSDCVTKQVAIKIQDSITVVSCPGLDCKSVLELDACRPWLPKELLERWDQALCEALFLAAPKYYCPFKDCSAMLLIENEEDHQAIRESECPVCHRLFCAKCDVPWHPGVDCEEFQGMDENEKERQDLIVRELAKEKKWKRCPNCKFIVEKTEGCMHITCRCHYEFCYQCGEQWTSTHGGCVTNQII